MTRVPNIQLGALRTASIDNAVTDRERFAAVLSNGPLLKADVVVCLCGEDAEPRVAVASHLVKTGGAPFIVLTGGKHDGQRWFGANELAPTLYGMGIAPDHIIIDDASQNTREQAVAVISMAIEEKWAALLLVASPYHMGRAFLTFLKVLRDTGQGTTIRIIPVPASHVAWKSAPKGMTETRLNLLSTELAKCEEYAEHVAPFADGLDYLLSWECR